MGLSPLDLAVFLLFILAVIAIALYASRKARMNDLSTQPWLVMSASRNCMRGSSPHAASP
jgi:hypothetical protein